MTYEEYNTIEQLYQDVRELQRCYLVCPITSEDIKEAQNISAAIHELIDKIQKLPSF